MNYTLYAAVFTGPVVCDILRWYQKLSGGFASEASLRALPLNHLSQGQSTTGARIGGLRSGFSSVCVCLKG